MLSKCPNCKSTFEIDEIQLTAADGLVRCGACLHVFNGRQHLSGQKSAQKEIKKLSGIDEELEAIEAQIQAIAKQRTAPKSSKSLDAEIADFSKLFDFDDDKTTPLKNFREEIETFDITKGKPEHFETTEDFYSEDWDETRTSKTANKALEKTKSITTAKKRSKLEEDIDNFFATNDKVQHKGSGAETVKQEKAPLPPKKNKISHIDIQDEPLSLQTEEKQLSKKWLVASIIGVVTIGILSAGMVLMVQFQDLSQNPVWRPRLAVLCAIVQCELPPTYSTQFLKVTSLTTTAFDDKVEVNAVIFNTNPNFDMPFPHLKMKFSDLNNKPVAEFDVHPDEYRQGELKRFEDFPSNTSAHITFILPSPGEDGVNYTLNFSYPE